MTPGSRALALLCALLGSSCRARDIELTPAPARPPDAGASADLENVVVIGPGAPEDAPALFARDTDEDRTDEAGAPRIVYPSDETMFPRNLAPVLQAWRAPVELDLFELRFDSDVAHVRYYTGERSLLPEPPRWQELAAAHAGGSLQLSVRGLHRDAPETIARSQTVTLRFSRSEVLGALYYWSTGAQGVMRAHISAASAVRFYTAPDGADAMTCVGCHTVSRDGRRLAVGYEGEHLREVTIPDREVLIPQAATAQPMPMPMPGRDELRGPEYGWGTFNPEGTRLLYANKGLLTLLDADTGEALAAIELPDGHRASHPDWSPDGRYVAVTYGASDRDVKNKEVESTSLARLPVDGDAFGAPELLLASSGPGDTLCFPVYSPDSRWLAFMRGTGKSKDSTSAELLLIAADGSGGARELALLNRRVRDEDGITGIGNTMPTWAPSTRADTFWLAFSSLRAYGETVIEEEHDQLWAAAIDPALIASGDDPSYAAFRLPFQDLQEGNHRAFWTLAAEDECPSTIELCDHLDNDCDGFVDEQCCTPSPEVCGDQLDNDCDGLADERCNCGEVEICDNSQDDDCDLNVDEDCLE